MNINNINQPFIQNFSGDFSGNPMQRQTPKLMFAVTKTVGFPNAELLIFNESLSIDIGLGKIESQDDLDFLAATNIPEKIITYATAYAGHQFGIWAGQLGDGRAIYAGEIKNPLGQKTEIQWKGAGATPYSRFGDGRAVLRSSVREYLMSEAMYHLGIPTTRALSLSLTGEMVMRDLLYDGHPKEEKGAVIVRTAETFLRFGHFELISAQNEKETLKKLADYSIAQYFPMIDIDSDDKYKIWFSEICSTTADLMVEWSRVGFVHGVMNTDNMSILGLTIDYGPFSMLDEFDLNFTPNTTDLPGRRYAFGEQPKIAQWNLWQLANALHPLINDEKFLETELEKFGTDFWKKHDKMYAQKFGFDEVKEKDISFFYDVQNLMQDLRLDYTLFFFSIEKWRLTKNTQDVFSNVTYKNLSSDEWNKLQNFLDKYALRLDENKISVDDSLEMMKKVNPKFILRNYILYQCIAELEAGKKDLLNKILHALENPYQDTYPEFSQKRPIEYDGTAGCSTLSCSS